MPSFKKIELLAPAGNFEKLETAIHYGADAVYLAGKDFSLRNFSGNFTIEEMRKAVSYAHGKDVKVYVACNIYPRTHEESAISEFLEKLGEIHPDAVIIADPGILMQAKKIIPHIPIHLSTQSNTTSRQSALFWASQGVTRLNTARELTLEEIKTLALNLPVEIETFVHGAMCISYSGRCLLSSFMARRDSNRGMCAHPCRWKYSVVEELRPGHYMPLYEDDRGSYIFNSRDLCMIDHIPAMIHAGISSLKIEGRMKGLNYLAATVQTYRQAIDLYYMAPDKYLISKDWQKTLAGINQRGYCTGFYLDDPDASLPNYKKDTPENKAKFVGKIVKKVNQNQFYVGVRNKIQTGDTIDLLTAKGPNRTHRIAKMMTEKNEEITVAQPNSHVFIETEGPSDCQPNDIIQKTNAE
ncbi:MAG: U32 family peptidase [Desulfobacteraceae bacterium]|nr:U32 family peptidase [Desulfobacteraceae bacterium]